MINNNFKKILKCLFTYENAKTNTLKLIGINSMEIREEGDDYYILPFLNTSLNTIINSDGISSKVKGGVCMGFGDSSKEVSLEDYNLDNIIDFLSYLSSSVVTTKEGYIVTTSVKNTTSRDIIVSEVGLFCRGERKSTYSASEYPFMLTRNVLETPITIKPGETKTFTITINF